MLKKYSWQYWDIKFVISGPKNSENGTGDETGILKSEVIHKEDRRYYMDLKENQRGRFLRVIFKISQLSSTFIIVKGDFPVRNTFVKNL